MIMQVAVVAGLIFVAPLLIGLAGGGAAVAGGAADVATRDRPVPVRLAAIAAAVTLAALLWSSVIVWIFIHTKLLPEWPSALSRGLAAILGFLPTLNALLGLPRHEVSAACSRRPVERPALMIAAVLNAAFLVAVLA